MYNITKIKIGVPADLFKFKFFLRNRSWPHGSEQEPGQDGTDPQHWL